MKMVTDRIRTYTELIQFPTFEERFEYLNLGGIIGVETFGALSSRWMNQNFYRSNEWKQLKNQILIRDNACDMALQNYPIGNTRIYIHHMNPITEDDIVERTPFLLDPEYLICVSFETHNAIHFGDINVSRLAKDPVLRQPNDQCPWKSDYQVAPHVTARGFDRRTK